MPGREPLHERLGAYLSEHFYGGPYADLARRFKTSEDQMRRAASRLVREGRAETGPDVLNDQPRRRGRPEVAVYAAREADDWEAREMFMRLRAGFKAKYGRDLELW